MSQFAFFFLQIERLLPRICVAFVDFSLSLQQSPIVHFFKMSTAHELSAFHPTLHTAKHHHNLDSHAQDLEQTTTSRSRNDYDFPEGGLRAWLVILGSFSIISGTFGLLSSVGIFSAYWQQNQLKEYTSRDIGWIAAVNVFLNLFLGVQIGPMFDKYDSLLTISDLKCLNAPTYD